MHSTNPIPRTIESDWNTISGELICSDCKHVLRTYGREGADPHLWPALTEIHICPSHKFQYNFNDPLTIKQQYERAKYEAIKIPDVPMDQPKAIKAITDLEERRKRLGYSITIKT